MKERKLRIGMIGAGGISHLHCTGWTKLPGCELVSITDINKAAAAKRAEEFKIPEVASSAGRVIARRDIDVIDIVVPNRFHKDFTVAALNAGKHVLCEKPLALSARDVDAMIAAAGKNKKKLMCAQHMRFLPTTKAMKEYLAKRPLGEVYYARAWHNRRRLLPTTPGFMYKKNSGGGCCIDIGVHVLDTALWLMGNYEPVSVTGVSVQKLARRRDAWSEWGLIDKKNVDVEDFAAGFIRFANGAVLNLECSFLLNQKLRYEERVDLFGAEAGARWPECEYYQTLSRDYVETKIDVRPGDEPHHAEIKSFAESVMAGKPVAVPPEQTRAVISILEGLYKSQKTGKEVRL